MYGYTSDGRKLLEPLSDKFLEWYDSRRKIHRVNAYSKAHGSASLYDAMDMIETLLIMHQSKFYINPNYAWSITMPFLFVQPKGGDILINETTKEEYEIIGVEELNVYERKWQDAPKASKRKKSSFSGRIILKEGVSAPTRFDRLVFKDIGKNYINFFEWGTRRAATKPYNSNSDASEQQDGPFTPTLTWNVKRVEPASIGSHPFDPAKELRPRIREQIPDPQYTYLKPTDEQSIAGMAKSRYPISTGWSTDSGTTYTGAVSYRILMDTEQSPTLSTHSITIYGQRFDNIVQFDCWSDNNYEASYLVSWFEDFMDLYTPVLKINGVNEILYWQRSIDQKIERWRNDIDNRTIDYYFRTETLKAVRSTNLNKFNIRVSVSKEPSTVLMYGEPTGIGTTTGMYGIGSTGIYYDGNPGVFYTGDRSYNYGTLQIME